MSEPEDWRCLSEIRPGGTRCAMGKAHTGDHKATTENAVISWGKTWPSAEPDAEKLAREEAVICTHTQTSVGPCPECMDVVQRAAEADLAAGRTLQAALKFKQISLVYESMSPDAERCHRNPTNLAREPVCDCPYSPKVSLVWLCERCGNRWSADGEWDMLRAKLKAAEDELARLRLPVLHDPAHCEVCAAHGEGGGQG